MSIRLKDDMDLRDSINDDDHKITSPDSLVSPFKSKGMHRLANKFKEKENIREYSPSEVKMLDEKGKEIVEILQEEGTIK